jgi:dihydroflavonol-4-reductase
MVDSTPSRDSSPSPSRYKSPSPTPEDDPSPAPSATAPSHSPSPSTPTSTSSELPLVLVTGGTGFLAKWVIATLLRSPTPYRIRTTIRTPSRIDEIKSCLLEAGVPEHLISSIEFTQADLSSNDGWTTALKDVSYVQHIASPFPAHPPKDEYDLIIPAVEGTKRVMRAARDAGVKRVVLTSSFAAVAYGARHVGRDANVPIIEDDWTDLSKPRIVPAYAKSKTLAERAAWEIVESREGALKSRSGSGSRSPSTFASGSGTGSASASAMELVVINPVNIYGPALGREDSTTFRSISEFLDGNAPGIPRVQYGVVDVRDCAELHVLAMTHASAPGERFICIGEGSLWMEDIAKFLKKNLGDKAKKVPTMVLPDMLVRGVGMFMPVARLLAADLGVHRMISGQKAREVLGWESQYGTEEAILAAAESILKFNT